MKKSYTCPSCGEKQTTVRQWQTVSVSNDYSLNKEEWVEDSEGRADGADHESFGCPNCGEDLPQEIVDKLKLWERI